MLGNDPFYHAGFSKATALIGTLFNDVVIERTTSTGTQLLKVPLTYGPREKYLGRTEGDPELDKKAAVILPRIGFELTGWDYADQRKLGTLNAYKQATPDSGRTYFTKVWQPVPYDLTYAVSVLGDRAEDVFKVVEQVLPYFAPDWTPTVFPVEEFPGLSLDVPIVLRSTSLKDTYQPDLKDRRIFEAEMVFTVGWNFYGPDTTAKVIKFVKVDLHPAMAANTPAVERVTVQPGLTANGEATTDPDLTVPYDEIDFDDPYGYVVQILGQDEINTE
jgi:hypothetical protein